MTVLLNLYGGPGCGKSTTAAGVFSELKQRGFNVEYVSEYAKDLTWEGDMQRLDNPLLVSGEQLHRTNRLMTTVDAVITDSPILLSQAYCPYPETNAAIVAAYRRLIEGHMEINVMLERVKDWNPIGRNQTLEEAKTLDSKMYEISGLNIFDMVHDLEGGQPKTIQKLSDLTAEAINGKS